MITSKKRGSSFVIFERAKKMKKLLVMLLVVGVLVSTGGCDSVALDGFSVGVVYLNTDLTTTNSINAGHFGQFTDEQTTKVEGLMPTFSLNFKFK